MKCENCLYKKNCQFLTKYKNADIDDCTAFVNEIEFVTKIKTNTIREFSDRLKSKCHDSVELDDYRITVVTKTDIDDLGEEMVVDKDV